MRRIRCGKGLWLACLLAAPAHATPGQADLCLRAAEIAADETGVPLEVMLAVALTETGRKVGGGAMQPWPWVSNQGGEAHWFDSQAEAVDYVESQIAAGVSNIDLGCFQLNHRWHSAQFASTEAMFDPVENARYAARLLGQHYENAGDWSKAAGAYHSGTPEYADRYRTRFETHYAALADAPLAIPALDLVSAEAAPVRQNNFPLLLAGNRASGPSLFPTLSPGRRLIGD